MAMNQLASLAAHSRPRILIVEDDVDSWKLFEFAVHRARPEAEIQWASDAASARLALETCVFDAVLADFTLENSSNGWRVLSECRRLQPTARVGMTSALPLRLPPNESCPFLQKPFEIASCVAFVRELLATVG